MQKQKTVKDLKEIIEKYNITIIKLDVSLSEEEMCELTRLDQFIFIMCCCGLFGINYQIKTELINIQ